MFNNTYMHTMCCRKAIFVDFLPVTGFVESPLPVFTMFTTSVHMKSYFLTPPNYYCHKFIATAETIWMSWSGILRQIAFSLEVIKIGFLIKLYLTLVHKINIKTKLMAVNIYCSSIHQYNMSALSC